MGELRIGMTATVLPDGRVLIIGGGTLDASGNLATVSDTVEVYDPVHGQFLPTNIILSQPRAFHTATLLETGEAQGEGKWKDHEHELFMETLKKVRDGSAGYPMYQWGSFSKNIPGRVGYQCSNYYRTLIKSGEVEDSNYMTDEKGELRFNFKNKGFERKNKDTGVSEIVTIKPRKPKPPPKPKPVKVPKPPKPKKEKKPKKPKPTQEEREDKDFRCSAKFETTRRSGRNAGKEKKYTEDGEEEEEEEAPVLPGFVDPLTKMQVEEPAISPYGHVAGYETWCRILRQEGTKDTCPFTRQPLKRRELVKLTHENIAEYREKMVDTQQ